MQDAWPEEIFLGFRKINLIAKPRRKQLSQWTRTPGGSQTFVYCELMNFSLHH